MKLKRDKRIGLALGGGGAKGLAHVAVLEVFDDLGVRPCRISGTSIGAIIGALYSSGITAKSIRQRVMNMVVSKGSDFRDILKRKKDVFKWIEFLDFSFSPSGIFKGDKFINFLYEVMDVKYFNELDIPLSVVATDFWSSEQVVIESGELLPAVKASMGLPGVFTPVELSGRVMIDGGGVNPVPHDILVDCDVVVAVDVMGGFEPIRGRLPHLVQTVLNTFDIMQKSIIREKLKNSPPDIYIRPDILDVDLLEFFKAEKVFQQAKPACELLKQKLTALL
ncbi:MAG: patatin-like phospholipase family protein [Candidatus Omnitrophica bacterium]|nr:patatin-like phospholipase family protein [Candidatus Omnitrophota bacterium]